jgi:HD-GYP domain-containing protein (c-di-GMP phosphodiesterase class II)
MMIWILSVETVIVVIAFFIMFWYYRKRILEQQLELLAVLASIKDGYTDLHQEHCYEVTKLLIDRLPQHLLKQINVAKLLKAVRHHDVGKLFVDSGILEKADALTEKEFDKIKLHVTIGSRIIQKTLFDKDIADFVLYHHERADSNGYLKRSIDDVPLEARIISCCDVYSACTTTRSYRRRYSIIEALDILRDVSGTQLDSEIVDVFLKIDVKDLVAVDNKFNGVYLK